MTQLVEVSNGKRTLQLWLPEKKAKLGRTIQYQGKQYEVVTVYYQTRKGGE